MKPGTGAVRWPAAVLLALPALMLAPLYGIWPLDGLMSLGLTLPALGAIECFAQAGTWLHCPLTVGSAPHAISYGLPVVQLTSLVHRLGPFDLLTSWNLTGLGLLYLAGLGSQAFLRAMGAAVLPAVFGSLLFLALPVVYAKSGYPLMLWGFALLPLLLWAQYRAWQLDSHWLAFGLFGMALTLGLFQEPYSLVMALTFGGWLALVQLAMAGRGQLFHRAVRAVIWLLACALAVLLYRRYIPGGADYAVMGMDFFRGQGIDLVALIARHPELYAFGPIWGVGGLAPQLFFTDGEMTAHSYLGAGLLIGAMMFAVSRRFWRSRRDLTLVLTFTGAFVMALGPSLKINSVADGRAADDPITIETYRMPAEAAIMTLPHQFIYELPPFAYMRSVSRWYVLAALMLVTMLVLGAQTLARRGGRPGLAAAVVLLAAVTAEHWPNLQYRQALVASFGELYRQMDQALVPELAGLVRPEERVVFLGGERLVNEFFSTFLCARAGCRTFNASTDKAYKIALSGWPQAMRLALDRPAEPAVRADLLAASPVDALVLSHFHLRWDSYTWPPPDGRRETMIEQWVEPYRSLDGVTVESGRWFSVVRPRPRPESDGS
ncbi:MAG: hypothetical protein ACLFSC_11915 [Wenzhouxiangella sp.]